VSKLKSIFQNESLAPISFGHAPPATVLHKNLPHQLCGNRYKVRAIFELSGILLLQTQICLMNQGCALQGVTETLIAKITMSNLAEFVIHERQDRR